jgi:hypothetical protein
MLDLGWWQPDWVFVSAQHKKIALVDLCRSADGLPNQLTAASTRKQQKYYILVEAMTHCVENGWVVHVFPWVVGIRLLLDPRHINALLEFLEIHKRHWQTAAEKTVLALVCEFYFMHRVRYGGSPGGQPVDQTLCTRANSDEEDDSLDEMEAQATRKQKPVAAPVRRNTKTFPATVRADPPMERKMRRTHLGTCQVQRGSGSTMSSKAQRPPNGGGTRQASNLGRRGHIWRRYHSQRDTTEPGAVVILSAAPADCEMNHRPDSPQLSRCKRKVSYGPKSFNNTYDPGGRQTLGTNSTRCGIAGGSWLIEGDD